MAGPSSASPAPSASRRKTGVARSSPSSRTATRATGAGAEDSPAALRRSRARRPRRRDCRSPPSHPTASTDAASMMSAFSGHHEPVATAVGVLEAGLHFASIARLHQIRACRSLRSARGRGDGPGCVPRARSPGAASSARASLGERRPATSPERLRARRSSSRASTARSRSARTSASPMPYADSTPANGMDHDSGDPQRIRHQACVLAARSRRSSSACSRSRRSRGGPRST